MPKPLIGQAARNNRERLELSISSPAAKFSPVELDRRLRVRRSPQYIQAVQQLDIGETTMNQAVFDAFVAAIKQEFPEIELECLPVGIVAKCYLGHPYEVHTLDMVGSIIRHYKISEALPPLLERARGLALHGGYEFIEVYTNAVRAIKKDGSVAVIKD